MSKRAGTVLTLEDLVEAIGVDAARYALVRSSTDSTIDIDLELWARKTSDNPVFYVQYAATRAASVLRHAGELGIAEPDPAAVDLSLLAHPREAELLLALAEFPPVVASAAELREPHRVARYLEEKVAKSAQRFWDECNVLPKGDEDGRADHRAPAAALARHPHGAGERPRAARRRAPRSGCERAVRELAHRPRPGGLAGRRQRVVGAVSSAASTCATSPREFGTPAYVLDEADFRGRCRAWRDAFAGGDVYYAGKAFLCTAVARWVAQEGLSLDVCTGGELAVALRAGFPAERLLFHGNNKSVAELTRAVEAGVGRVVIDSLRGAGPARAGRRAGRGPPARSTSG